MDSLKKRIISAIPAKIDSGTIEIPPDKLGDYAVPCFSLAKVMKKSPQKIAEELKDKVKTGGIIDRVEAKGGYLNFFLNPKLYAEEVLKTVSKPAKKKEKVMIEFSQVNTHKAFHVGHLRGTILGGSIVRLHRSQGYKTIAANYQGDIGAHVAKVIWYLEKYKPRFPDKQKGRWLGEIYQKANSKLADESYREEVSTVLQKLENKDVKMTRLWKKTRQWSLDDFEEFYELLGVSFDKYFFESSYEKPGKQMVKKLLQDGIAEKSEGAVIIDLKKLGKFLLLKTDGTALYSTKDIALASDKFKRYKINRSIYLVASEQTLYFQQIFKTLEIIGFKQAKNCRHVPYSLVTLKGGKISSREGELMLAEELVQDVISDALTQVVKRHKLKAKEAYSRARKIALAAIKFSFLCQDNNKDIVFDKEKSLAFEGETGPYIQYSLARINSILRKAGEFRKTFTWNVNKEEHNIIRMLAQYAATEQAACETFRPHKICRFLLDICQLFNSYYHNVPILKAKEDLAGRLTLLVKLKETLEHGLGVLGIESIEEM